MANKLERRLIGNPDELNYPIGVVADLHGNYYALLNILKAYTILPQELTPKSLIFLGDSSGYGPWPVGTTREVYKKFNVILRGNHDEAVVEDKQEKHTLGVDTLFENPFSKQVIDCHRELYDVAKETEGFDYVKHFKELQTMYRFEGTTFVHGSPEDHLDHYFTPDYSKQPKMVEGFLKNVEKELITGHTHNPMVIKHKKGNVSQKEKDYYPWDEQEKIFGQIRFKHFKGHYGDWEVQIRSLKKSFVKPDEKIVINFGSGGWPRDGQQDIIDIENPPKRLGYAKMGIITPEHYFFMRVEYNRNQMIKDMYSNEKLPNLLIKLFEKCL